MKTYDVAIIGGGLAGLISANYLARAGKSVVVLEKLNQLGGRAMTVNKNGALFNLGTHALYFGGEAETVLRELEIKIDGGKPPSKGYVIIWKNKIIHPTKLLTSRILSMSGKWELMRIMMKFGKMNPNEIPAISLREWAEKEIRDPMVRHIIYAICRTSSFSMDFDHQLAGPVLNIVKRGFKNGGLYVDGGWQQIVDKLFNKAVRYGVTFLTNNTVKEIEHSDGHVSQIIFANGETLNVKNVISTLAPIETYRLIRDAEKTSLKIWKNQARPSMAACLNLCLKKLPKNRNVAIGLDLPIFFTNQSATAKLTENGTQVMHLIKYNRTGGSNPKADQDLLMQTMDLIHPGWQKELVSQQFLPNMTVANDFCHIGRLDHYPGPAVPEIDGLFVAGEWAGRNNELLCDGAAGSAKRAAQFAIQKLEESV